MVSLRFFIYTPAHLTIPMQKDSVHNFKKSPKEKRNPAEMWVNVPPLNSAITIAISYKCCKWEKKRSLFIVKNH